MNSSTLMKSEWFDSCKKVKTDLEYIITTTFVWAALEIRWEKILRRI